MTPQPHTSYFVCMTPRTGSTLLCEALAGTGVAGRPEEYYLTNDVGELLQTYEVDDYGALQRAILAQGTSSNGVFGVKVSTGTGGGFAQLRAVVHRAAGAGAGVASPEAIRAAFPGLVHIFLTRRNKVRQAVSWWKAVQSNQWVRRAGEAAAAVPASAYTFAAIDHLVQEAVFREAAWQAYFTAAGVVPMAITYEDLVADTEGAVARVLRALGVSEDAYERAAPRTSVRQADAVSEAWVRRYREEKQAGWDSAAW